MRPGETAVFKVRRAEEILRLEVLAERISPDVLKAAESKLAPSVRITGAGKKSDKDASEGKTAE